MVAAKEKKEAKKEYKKKVRERKRAEEKVADDAKASKAVEKAAGDASGGKLSIKNRPGDAIKKRSGDQLPLPPTKRPSTAEE